MNIVKLILIIWSFHFLYTKFKKLNVFNKKISQYFLLENVRIHLIYQRHLFHFISEVKLRYFVGKKVQIQIFQKRICKHLNILFA